MTSRPALIETSEGPAGVVPAKPVLLHVPAVALEKVLVACQAAACVARLGSIMQQLKRESLMLLQVDKWAAHGRAALAGEQHPGIIRTLIWQILQCGHCRAQSLQEQQWREAVPQQQCRGPEHCACRQYCGACSSSQKAQVGHSAVCTWCQHLQAPAGCT